MAHYKLHSINSTLDHVGVAGAVNGYLVEFNANGLFADSGAKISDFSLTGHAHIAADITDFQTAVSANTDVANNTLLAHTQNSDTSLDFGNANQVSAAELRSHLDNNNAHNASDIDVVTTLFNGALSASDNTVQKALDTLDDAVAAGAAVWGGITGTLSNQVDLQNALNAKANVVHTHVASDVTDFDVEVGNHADVVANTSARHTQDSDLYLDFGNANQVSASELRAFVDSKAVANGLASLDATGKVPTAQLPAIAITDVYVVADITARDALTVQTGDVAKVTDAGSGQPETYIYDGSAWVLLEDSSDVLSVNGQTGVVVLTTTNVAEGSNLYYTESRVSANVDVVANTSARHTQNTDTALRTDKLTVDASGNTTIVGDLKIKVYAQANEPTLSSDEMMGIWKDTDDADKVFLIFRKGAGDQVSVEMA